MKFIITLLSLVYLPAAGAAETGSLEIAFGDWPKIASENIYSRDNPKLASELTESLNKKVLAGHSSLRLPAKVISLKEEDGRFELELEIDFRTALSQIYDDIDSTLSGITLLRDYDFAAGFTKYENQTSQTTTDNNFKLTYNVTIDSELKAEKFIEAMKMEAGLNCPATLSASLHLQAADKFFWYFIGLQQISFKSCKIKME